MTLYINTKAKIMTPAGITLEFLTNLGILQGDVLAPLIFIIVLDFIIKLAIGPCDGFKVGINLAYLPSGFSSSLIRLS